MGSSDAVGQRGEWICTLKLTSFHEDAQLFRPVFLGDELTSERLVELRDEVKAFWDGL